MKNPCRLARLRQRIPRKRLVHEKTRDRVVRPYRSVKRSPARSSSAATS